MKRTIEVNLLMIQNDDSAISLSQYVIHPLQKVRYHLRHFGDARPILFLTLVAGQKGCNAIEYCHTLLLLYPFLNEVKVFFGYQSSLNVKLIHVDAEILEALRMVDLWHRL